MKTLNVQKVSREEIMNRWGSSGKFLPKGELFIRSNRFGFVNWDRAPVYSWAEIQKEQKKRAVHFTVPPKIFEL